MKCTFCGSLQSSVIDKRSVKATGEIRRRRECLKCRRRYTTYETAQPFELLIIKRDGRKEIFAREKLRSGLERALEKRPAAGDLENIVDRIINVLIDKGKKEVDSRTVGMLALQELKKTDEVAYLRFASVYRHFKNCRDFSKELEHLARK